MRRVPSSPNNNHLTNQVPFVNEWLAAVTDRLNIYSGPADPVLTEIPENQWIIYRNTTTGEIKLVTRYGASITSISGSGDVVGPAVAVNNNVVLFSGVTGKLIKDSGVQMNAAGVGLGNVTNDAQTKAAVVPNTAPSNGQILVGNGTAYVPKAMSGDGTLSAAGAFALVSFGTVTGTSLTVTSSIGYSTGAGGTVSQLTSKATGVTLNKACGTITLNGAALAADTSVSFTFTNSTIAATDYVMVQHDSVGTLGAYLCVASPAAGSATITVRNVTPGALSEAIVLRFVVIKAVTA